ncbi:MAG: glycosyltransferase family 39 protein [Chloroflexi bacterium]|nr:glycosyltransferase family 39 protein [Chloroflexota bacterium]MCI0580920.1 glycosyltransferase family 39 protein [Chloroflexota bacterium]MCI0644815.1 glycosyltransferase family 39 protein [Chloroflexota bacterium]MCI0731459.1 glycosyltransferase family 39 protein [Chloroflexota bacterium]
MNGRFGLAGSRWGLVLLTLLAFGLRVWRLDEVPPGWRDDELIEALVISQKALDGDLAVYYPDASGHEALYHLAAAGLLAIFGPGALGIRLLSAILGTLTVPLTAQVATRLFGRPVGWLAAAGLALSFWSLMYSRFGIRHISTPVFMLAAFYAFWRGLEKPHRLLKPRRFPRARFVLRARFVPQPAGFGYFLLAGLGLGVGFYTYFASRGVPLILLAFGLYLALFERPLFRRCWRGLAIMFLLAAGLALPLALTLGQQPESEARVNEVGRPLLEALDGNVGPLLENTVRTLNMVHSDGDDEWLYNIPFRPVFGPVGAFFFWSGLAVAAWYALRPSLRAVYKAGRGPAFLARTARQAPSPALSRAAVFLLLWWLAGITPGFLSVPAASLSHTILAQPAIYILAALPVLPLGRWLAGRSQRLAGHSQGLAGQRGRLLPAGLGLLLLASIAWRDLPDYFREWPNRGMTRFLYRADVKELAHYLNERPELVNFGVTSLLAGPWDKLALELDLDRPAPVRPRWYNPERAILLAVEGAPALNFHGYPVVETLYEPFYVPVPGEAAGGYRLSLVNVSGEPPGERAGLRVCFRNGLCSLAATYDPEGQTLALAWEVGRPLELPPVPLISNPPPPGVYAGPRLVVFAQLVDAAGNFLVGDDGLWVDVTSLYPGDRFLQQHRLPLPAGRQPAAALFGLYDPLTGERILTEDGRDHVRLEVEIGE